MLGKVQVCYSGSGGSCKHSTLHSVSTTTMRRYEVNRKGPIQLVRYKSQLIWSTYKFRNRSGEKLLKPLYPRLIMAKCRSQWTSGLRRGSAAARLLGLRIRIPPGAWMCVCCECCVCLSGRGLCDGLITRPEESYRLCCVIVCDLELSRLRSIKPARGL
jgi:hypothetical protein